MSSRIHPKDALFDGEKPFPIINTCEHFAGSEKLIAKAMELQERIAGIFDSLMDGEDERNPRAVELQAQAVDGRGLSIRERALSKAKDVARVEERQELTYIRDARVDSEDERTVSPSEDLQGWTLERHILIEQALHKGVLVRRNTWRAVSCNAELANEKRARSRDKDAALKTRTRARARADRRVNFF